MNDKNMEPIIPTFRSRNAQPQSSSGIWGGEQKRSPIRSTFGAFQKENSFSALSQMPCPSRLGPRNELISPLGSSNVEGFSNMITPPRDMSTSNNYDNSANMRSLSARDGSSSSGIRGLLPDESADTTFNVELVENADDIISGLKLQIETLITAFTLKNASSDTADYLHGTDPIEVSHRIMTRLRLLREENERLAQLTTGSHAAKLEVKNFELQEQNQQLRTQLMELQQKRKAVGS